MENRAGSTTPPQIMVASYGIPIHFVLGNSGVITDTSELGPYTDQLQEKDPGLFERRLNTIKNQVYEMKDRLAAKDLEKVGSIMTENQKILCVTIANENLSTVLLHPCIHNIYDILL